MAALSLYSPRVQERVAPLSTNLLGVQQKVDQFINRNYKFTQLSIAYTDRLNNPEYEEITMDEMHELLLAEFLTAIELIDELKGYKDPRDKIPKAYQVDTLLETFLTYYANEEDSTTGGKMKKRRGGMMGIDYAIATILFEILGETGHYIEMYNKNIELKLTNQTMVMKKIDKQIVKAITKRVHERFNNFLTRDGNVLLSRAPELRQILREEYKDIIEKNIPVANLPYYKRLYGEQERVSVNYTYGDLVFDLLLKSNVTEETIQRIASQRIGRSATMQLQRPSQDSVLKKFFNIFKKKNKNIIHPLPSFEMSEANAEDIRLTFQGGRKIRLQYDKMTVAQLQEYAKRYKLKGYSKLKKLELIQLLHP